FNYCFYRRALDEHGKYTEAKVRAGIYTACGVAMAGAILVLGLDSFISGHPLSSQVPRLVFYGEATALVSFGISWLTARRTLPLSTHRHERFSASRATNPD